MMSRIWNSIALAICALCAQIATAQASGMPLFGVKGFPEIPAEGVPMAQIFDGRIAHTTDYTKYKNKTYFIWGAGDPAQPAGVVASKYFPSMRTPERERDLAWYQQHHPDWVLYQADRKTPAYGYIYSYGGLVPLDLANPEVRQYYLNDFILPAVKQGYRMVAMDNVEFSNWPKAIGHFEKGEWKQRYTGEKNDPAFFEDVANWMKFLSEQLHPLDVRVAANIKANSAPPDKILQVIQSVDLWLDESGFTHRGVKTTDKAWAYAFDMVRKTAAGRSYVSINQLNGPVDSASRELVEWTLASFLLARGPQSMLALTGYADGKTRYQEFHYRDEADVAIGSPLEEAKLDPSGVWLRKFSGGWVIVNPSGQKQASLKLPPGRWRSITNLALQNEVTIPPATGYVLIPQTQAGAQARPSWIKDLPMVMAGNWDLKPIFKTRQGGKPVWHQANYEREQKPETIDEYKRLGVSFMMINFYKAFGLDAESEEIQNAIRFSKTCHDKGLKVGAYVGATMAYETFLAEQPEAKDWLVPDYMGKTVTYGSQTFRKLVYFQHPGYKAYIKRVLKMAIEDAKVDLIHFDNSSIQAIPQVFYHPLAVQEFKDFLKHKYSPARLKERLGFSVVDYIEPPQFSATVSTIDDPLAQEWIDFRCQRLADYYEEMANYIRSLNPNVAVENNPHGLAGINTMWTQSVDFPRLLASLDYFWTEGEQTGLGEAGALISKIRTFKMARVYNTRVFVNTSHSLLKKAESMAFDRQGIGLLNDGEEMDGTLQNPVRQLPEDEQRYIDFFKSRFDLLYKDVVGVADVAVFHGFASMSYNSDRPYQSTALFEQALIQHHIPFDIIFDQQLDQLDHYKVIVLADQECLSAQQLVAIDNYVKKGGSVVLTEHTSLYNEWRQRLPDFGLAKLTGVHAPEWRGRASDEGFEKGEVVKKEYGKGRVVYLPEVRPSIPKPAAAIMTGKYLKPALNEAELIAAVDWAINGQYSIRVEGSPLLATELWQKTSGSTRLLHLVNYDDAHVASGTRVTVPGQVSKAVWYSPDLSKEITLKIDKGMIQLPDIPHYGILAFN